MKKILFTGALGLLITLSGLAETGSLADLFSLGKTILDLDGDGLGDKIALSIVVPDGATAAELCLAADIAARANFESLRLDFGLLRRESEIDDWAKLPFPLIIGGSGDMARTILRENRTGPESIAANQGLILTFEHDNRPGVLCVAGSDESLLRTGRAYFLRWPYFWEIWGREAGGTYLSLEKDIRGFLTEAKIGPHEIGVRSALYEFPKRPVVANALQSLIFDEGQIKTLTVRIRFDDPDGRAAALRALTKLRDDQRRGIRTSLLSYSGCAELAFELHYGGELERISLSRTGATKRLLTPAFKPRPGAEPTGKEFDLTELFTSKAFYADQDLDGIPDRLDSIAVIPPDLSTTSLAELTSRLMLDTAGASFPIAYFDSEIETRKSLPAPILIGQNSLAADLIRTGKIERPDLQPGQGMIRIVPTAFGKSGALLIGGADSPALEKTLAYFARTFPYLSTFGAGRPEIKDVRDDFEALLEGKKGGAEAFFSARLGSVLEGLKGKALENLDARLLLPRENEPFRRAIERKLEEATGISGVGVVLETLRSGREVFRVKKPFVWEVDEALDAVAAELGRLEVSTRDLGRLEISLGVSESASVREQTRARLDKLVREAGIAGARTEVLSAYKPGYFWMTEKILPRLKTAGADKVLIRFAEEKEDLTRPKRSYPEPTRWLKELYPVDDVISRETGIPLDRIEFEMKEGNDPVYEVRAFDSNGSVLFEEAFSPRIREIPFLDVLPEWGTVRVTTGWLRIEGGGTVLLDHALPTDTERFWSFYQGEVLRPLYDHILKKTGREPTFSKQPYFKRLVVDVRLSEPDTLLGLDEEIVSSLEALHDEIYFDTLDFLRGITRFDPEDTDLPTDASRSSAPGNIMPLIRPSLEGGAGEAEALLEDWPGRTPQLVLEWTEKGRGKASETIAFPSLKPKKLSMAGLVFDGPGEKIERLLLETEWAKEPEYLAILDILESHRRLQDEGLIADPFRYPGLGEISVGLRTQDRNKREQLTVVPPTEPEKAAAPPPPGQAPIVTTSEIISPSLCLDIVDKLGRFEGVRTYIGGRSYEGRDVPVLELYLPPGRYVSLPRLVSLKPTLQLVGRQHANEVSSTNYLLKFAELIARDESSREALKKMNIVIQPMENPDGAELAFELHKIEPFHSLHAGRYSSLGVDIGYGGGGRKPLLPEAAVRANLFNRWFPDIFLNLHGYPSHEWVQQFSNYTPYLFRDYWIPKGWFVYYRALRLPLYEKWVRAGEELMESIIRELEKDDRVSESNRKFYDRYKRWASRWAPHTSPLEIYGGVNIFAKRRSSSESRLSQRTKITYVEETPELMDETATGDWLDFLCDQGLAYLEAHVRYLSQAEFPRVRLEEESRNRIRITLLRGRPGSARVPD